MTEVTFQPPWVSRNDLYSLGFNIFPSRISGVTFLFYCPKAELHPQMTSYYLYHLYLWNSSSESTNCTKVVILRRVFLSSFLHVHTKSLLPIIPAIPNLTHWKLSSLQAPSFFDVFLIHLNYGCAWVEGYLLEHEQCHWRKWQPSPSTTISQ